MSFADKAPLQGKKVQLMATCLCDAFFDDVAMATVEVLEHLGCEVHFPTGQTCCGQPAFNAGDWDASRKVVRHTAEIFAGDLPIVTPSGSCAAMLFHGAPLEFEKQEDRATIEAMARRTWEITDFIVNGLQITQWPGKWTKGKVAFHRSCHTRGTRSGDATRQLLDSIEGMERVEFGEQEQCCGFGGTFAVTFPHVSKEMGQRKLDHVQEEKPAYLVSGDMGCLLHLGGMATKSGLRLKTYHVVQVLRDALAGVSPAVDG